MKPENYLKNAEMAMEDDYGMLDGIINNGKAFAAEERPSVLEQLKEMSVFDTPHKPPRSHPERDKAWADISNAYLERAGSPERIDHRSNAERGIGEIPTVHMGVAACQMEKKCEICQVCRTTRRQTSK